MPIRIDCPRCHKPLAVPSKMAGSYVTCPRCQGRLWVPPPAEAGPAALGARLPAPATDGGQIPRPLAPGGASPKPIGAAPLATPPPVTAGESGGGAPPAPPPVCGPPISTPRDIVPAGAVPPAQGIPGRGALAGAEPAVAPPPVVPIPRRTIARFITAELSSCRLPLTADGKLPELKLGETDGEAADRPARARGAHPLVLFGLLAASLGASVLLILAPSDATAPNRLEELRQARRIIETEYFRELDEGVPPRPYQLLLREAKLAHSRGDVRRERDLYRRVLDLLRAYPKPEKGVTGSVERDERLERQLIVLLSE